VDLPFPFVETTVVAAALVTARVIGFVAVGSLPLGPGVPMPVRLALAWALAIAAVTWVVPGAGSSRAATSLVVALPSELLLGGLFGLSVACVTAAVGWAGGVLGTLSGLSWADDFSSGPVEATTPLARLLWWSAAGAFISCGGARVVLLGLLESFATLPVGTWLAADVDTMLLTSLAMACRLTVALMLPAMVAVLVWHISAAIACRVVPLSPSAGLLQGTAAVVLLVAVWTGSHTWTDSIAEAMTVTCERIFEQAVPLADTELP